MKIRPPDRDLHYMVIAATLVYHNRQNLVRESLRPMAAHVGGLSVSRDWYDYMIKGEEDIFELRLRQEGASARNWSVRVNGIDYQVVTPIFEFYRRRLRLEIEGEFHRFLLQTQGNFTWAAFNGITRTLEIYSPLEWKLTPYVPIPPAKGPENVLPSPMPGMIVEIRVQEGDRVYKGQELVIIESMKMESGVAAPREAVVEKVMVRAGQAVDRGDALFIFRL